MRRRLRTTLACIVGTWAAASIAAQAAPAYRLAFFREVGDYENHGNHSFYVHVWDAAGNPVEGVLVRSTDGTASGVTNARGAAEIPLYMPGPFTFEVVAAGADSDQTPPMVVNRSPDTGHYSWEAGFLFKASDANVGSFDTTLDGELNLSGGQAWDIDQPTTRSVVYRYWLPDNWNADFTELADWAIVEQGQAFTIPTGTTDPIDRIVACNFQCTRGAYTKVAFGVQIHEGGPTGPAIGPPAFSQGDVSVTINSDEFKSFLVTWGLTDNPVTAGETYYARVFPVDQPETPDVNESLDGMNSWVCPNDNYGDGDYHHEGLPVAERDLMGFVVGAHTGSSGTGTPAFVWTDNFEEVSPAAGANEWSPLNYGPKADKGTWENLNFGHTVNNDPGAWGDGTRQVSSPNAGTVIALSQEGAVGPGMSWAWRQVDGLTPGAWYRLSYWCSTSGWNPPPPGAAAIVGYSQQLDDGVVNGVPPASIRYPGDGVSAWTPAVGIAERCAQLGQGDPVYVHYQGEFAAEGNSVKVWMAVCQTELHAESAPFPWRLFDLYVDDVRLEEISEVLEPPVLTSIERAGSDMVTIRWTSTPGIEYLVWFADDPVAPAWTTNLTSRTTAVGAVTDWDDPVGAVPRRVYRVEAGD